MNLARPLDRAEGTLPPIPMIAHIVDATGGPLVGEGCRARIAPFALTALLSLAFAGPLTTWLRPEFAVAAGVVVVVTLVVALLTRWRRVPRSWQLAVPFVFLVVVLLLMASTGQDVHSPFVSLLVLPLMWLALYETRSAVLVAAGVTGAALAFGHVSLSAGTASDGPAAIIVLTICCAGMGITLNQLVADARSLAVALREHHFALEHLSLHDPLTDLSNRRGFAGRTRRARERAVGENRPFSVLYIDLNRFKELNDTLGHDAGDLLLEEVAGRLRGLVRATDTVARLGGDEFAVLAEGSHPAQAAHLAERIEDALRQPYRVAPDLAVSASVGVAHSEDVGGDPDAALSAADKSMLSQKRDRGPT
jgi:diguanylate cyclase (GGDEF)-like protein